MEVKENTSKMYERAQRYFDTYIEENGIQYDISNSFAFADVLIGFIDWLNETPTTKGKVRVPQGTLTLYYGYISFLRSQGVQVNTRIKALSEKLKELDGKTGTQKKAKALLAADIMMLIDSIEGVENASVRDRAMISLGYAGGFRKSEIIDLNIEDVTITDSGMDVFIKKSKNEEVYTKEIPLVHDQRYCPVSLTSQWIDRLKRSKGALFTPRWREEIGKRLGDNTPNNMLKKRLQGAGFGKLKEYSWHSLRRGFVTQAVKRGLPIEAIMKVGGFRSFRGVQKYVDRDIVGSSAVSVF